jgi:IMP cyclohydrolase
MYLGRIVAIGMSKKGGAVGMYRISSRSFPDRETKLDGDKVYVVPRTGFKDDLTRNPYISYNCLNLVGEYAVISNGSHTDSIAGKILMGYPARDALALTLLAMDYEKDNYKTPRIAGIISKKSNIAYLAVVKEKALFVRNFELTSGTAYYVATYEHSTPCPDYKDVNFDAANALDARNYVINNGVFAELEIPVTSSAVFASDNTFELSAES